jgi:hypothetical protein
MTTIDLDEHPELAALESLLRSNAPVEIVRGGRVLGRIVEPTPRPIHEDMAAFRASLNVPMYPGNIVVEDRQAGDW